ncbi:MAG: hypothetical protein AAF789_01750 [Bacteroidota bacterium]
MTAVAGILNKQGVAIAADSAVTVTGINNRKVYNSANKIFTLSKYHPVGIAIYNNAQFMGISWETIIKEYRKQLKEKNFDHLEEFKDDFFNWLKLNRYFLSSENGDFLFMDFLNFIQTALNDVLRNTRGSTDDLENNLTAYLDNYISNEIPKHKEIGCFKTLERGKIAPELRKLIPEITSVLSQNFNKEFKTKEFPKLAVDAYFQFLKHDQFLQFTGLIFTGFGEKELFPQLIPVNVSLVINELLRYEVDTKKIGVIDKGNNACIAPFAQTDVIDTILQGISPELNQLSGSVFGEFLTSFLAELKGITGMPQAVQEHLDKMNVKEYINKYQLQFNNIVSKRYVSPLMGAVAQLSKEDLAEMAESLVYLTYLKRRFTMAEESVGGPVDIAVITKGDGFIWIKRKHYFDPTLNQTFFQKYL